MISEVQSIPTSVNPSDRLHIKDINSGGLVHDGYPFHKSGVLKNGIAYYRCAQKRRYRCPATININVDGTIKTNKLKHNHPPRKTKVSLFAGQTFNYSKWPMKFKVTNCIILGKKIEYNGCIFYKHSEAVNKIHWRCYQSALQCPVRLHTDAVGTILYVRAEHNHTTCT